MTRTDVKGLISGQTLETLTQHDDYERATVKYAHLSKPLKMAVVLAWVVGTFYTALFIIGFSIGLRAYLGV